MHSPVFLRFLPPPTDSGKVDFYNNLYLVATVMVAVATVFALVASGLSIKFSKRVGKTQDLHVKDQDLQITQLDKQIADAELAATLQGKHIADTQKDAALANQRAQEATERTAKLEHRASDAEAQAKRSQAEIAKANAAAQDANARAASAQAETAKANAISHKAAAEVAKAQSQIAGAQQVAAQANLVAETERLARIKLEAKLAPRTLTAEQQQKLIKTLTPYSPTSVDIYVLQDTTDSRTFSTILINCLASAGWDVHVAYASNSSMVAHGVIIGIRPGENTLTNNAGLTLVSELQTMDIATVAYDYDKMPTAGAFFNSNIGPPSQIRIFVGSKP